MASMTSHERFRRTFARQETDRLLMWDFPWPGTLKRWRREGMPADISYENYFDVDQVARIEVDNSPRYPQTVVEDNAEFKTVLTSWGCKERNFKHEDSTPDFMDYTIIDADRWRAAKSRMTLVPDRVPWDHLKANYRSWRADGKWILADTWFGFNHFISYVVGTERFLMYMLEEPELCKDMIDYSLDLNLKLLDLAWDAGYTFDMLNIRDDLGYKQTQFFSTTTYREIVKPAHQRAVDWAHGKGIKIRLHSCGYIMGLLPDILELGFDAIHPLEVKAGMNPVTVKEKYGDQIVIHGGLNAMLWKDRDAIVAEMHRLVPVLKQGGGYIFASDHSIPNDVSFQTMTEIIRLAKELGKG